MSGLTRAQVARLDKSAAREPPAAPPPINFEAARRYIAESTVVCPQTHCWEWRNARDDGWHRVQWQHWPRLTVGAFAWSVFYEALVSPDVKVIHDVCQNRRCANPAHVRICAPGGATTSAGRQPRPHLTAAQKETLRGMRDTHTVKQRAEHCGVSTHAVYRLDRGDRVSSG